MTPLYSLRRYRNLEWARGCSLEVGLVLRGQMIRGALISPYTTYHVVLNERRHDVPSLPGAIEL